MTQYSSPWDGTSIGDAGPYSAADWQQIWKLLFHGERADSGVLIDSGNVGTFGLQVTQSTPTGTSIDVLPGAALVQGAWYYSDDTETLAIAANASGNARIDTIILRADYPAQTVRVAVLQGTPAASPTPPALTQVAGVMWEIPLADVAAANGFISILDANITPRANWANAADGVYLIDVTNNSGGTLETGMPVVWDTTTNRAVTTTATAQANNLAGVWVGRTANGSAGRVQVQGIGFVRTTAAASRGNRLDTSTTTGSALAATYGRIGRVITSTSGAGLALSHIDVNTQAAPLIAKLQDQKAQNTAGGGSVSGSRQTRDLNTIVSNPGAFVTALAANAFTLAAGRYKLTATAPFNNSDQCRIYLRNNTAAVDVAQGSNVRASSSGALAMLLDIVFDANGTDTYSIQYRCTLSQVTTGLGTVLNIAGEIEIYTDVSIQRIV